MVPVEMESTTLAPYGRGSNGSNGSAVAVHASEPALLRERIAAPVELPRARRPGAATLAGLAAVAGIAAVALGALALVSALDGGSDDTTIADDADAAIGLLADPSTERIPLTRTAGSIVLVVASGGRSALVLDGLASAPSGKRYQAWVIAPAESSPSPAAVFSGGEGVVPLTRRVPPGASVGVTVENAVGVDTPSQRLRLVARRSP
jgi:hypothetical protein